MPVRRLALAGLGALLLALAPLAAAAQTAAAQTAAAQTIVADLPLSGGGSERALLIGAMRPRATLVLLAGGAGIVDIDGAGNISRNNNFLVRTRELWAARGYAVLVLGSPNGGSLMGQRHRPDYAAALRQAVDFARLRTNAPVFIVGTSQGSTGAANGAARLNGAIAGVVLTSTVTRLSRSGETVFDADLAAIAVPALIVANTGDTCSVSPPGDAPRIAAALTRAPRKDVVLVQSNAIRSAPCEALSPHGYLGIENETVQRIGDWIALLAPR